VAFPRTWWTDEQRIFALRDEAPGGKLKEQRAAPDPLAETYQRPRV
jgi:hypothetical protein